MSLNQSHEVSNDVILRKLEILSSIPSCAVPLTLWVNLDTSFTDLILFPHLCNGDKNSSHLAGFGGD